MAEPMYIYVGTYTRSLPHVQAKSEGIYLLQMDPTSGALTIGLASGALTIGLTSGPLRIRYETTS